MGEFNTDVLILGSGGAGLFAALHAYQASPELKATVAVKGLLNKCGCTCMVQGGYIALPTSLPNLAAGRVRALAVTTATRSPVLPAVPTLAESGFAGLDESQWYGMLVLAGTSPDIVAKIHADVAEVIRVPDIRANMAKLGAESSGLAPAQFGAYLRAEIAKFRKIVSDANITVQ